MLLQLPQIDHCIWYIMVWKFYHIALWQTYIITTRLPTNYSFQPINLNLFLYHCLVFLPYSLFYAMSIMMSTMHNMVTIILANRVFQCRLFLRIYLFTFMFIMIMLNNYFILLCTFGHHNTRLLSSWMSDNSQNYITL